MMDDDKKLFEGLDDSFDEHELDLNTPEDLNPIEDVTFSDTQNESLAIFDEFDDSNDLSAFDVTPEKEIFMKKNETDDSPRFDEFSFDESDFEIPAFEERETRKSDFDADIFAEHDFDTPDFGEPNFGKSNNQHDLDTDEDMFTSDAFDDVNADFPEGEASQNLGDSQLFDYDPSTSSTEENLGDDIYATAPAGAPKGGKGGEGASGANLAKNRRVIRVVVMIVLVGAVYGVLRLFMGDESNTMTNLAAPTEVTPAAPAPITTALPDSDATVTEPAPEVAATPEATTPSTDTSATPALAVPGTQPTTPQAATPESTATPAVTMPSSALSQAPQTSLNVPTPNTAVVPGTHTGTAPDQISHKLDTLEASIAAIDNKLANISSNNSGGSVIRGAIPAGQGNTFGKAPPESQEILMQTLSKIDGIDKKMSYLADLETQVHILNKEVNALKNDVVQQSIIVGQNQSHINQNLIAAIDANAPKMVVQAAIPGRAWLRSEAGQLLTVIPGDEVAGYGRVVSIDPTTGTVVMSSRAVFREQ